MTEEKELTAAQLARTRKKFGSIIGEEPKKEADATKAADDTLIDAEWDSAVAWAKKAMEG